MNLINDLESDLARAVLIEKRHAEKISIKDVLPLVERLNEALASISSKERAAARDTPAAKQAKNFPH